MSRIEIRLRDMTDDVLIASRRPSGDGAQPWLVRAMSDHGRQPFAAIIAHENPTAHAEVLVAAGLEDSGLPFQTTGQRHITRTAAEIVGCVELLLGVSKTVKLIDPHFDPNKSRWRRMLGRVLTALASSGQTGVVLEIHRANNALPGNLKHYFDSNIPGMLPTGVTVQVFLHSETAMHNRFIHSDVGGASYHTGLDDNEDGNSARTDLVSLLVPAASPALPFRNC